MVGNCQIVGYGNQRWALNIYDYLSEQQGVSIMVFRTLGDMKLEILDGLAPSLILFYGWQDRVPEDIIDKYTCLGLHPSLLPKYRGPDPLQNQIMNGEVEGAVSIFKLSSELDAGDLCLQVPLAIRGDLWEIFKYVTDIGAFETLKLIRDSQNGGIKFWPQEGEPTRCEKRFAADSEITAEELKYGTSRFLHNKIRSLQDPYLHNAFIRCSDGKNIFITEARCEE